MQLSRRLEWHAQPNAIARAVRERNADGGSLADLTLSNPTVAGFPPRPDLAQILRKGGELPYRPEAKGADAARVALAEWLGNHSAEGVDSGELILTSSTSEAYGWLLKLLCDPADRVLHFTPTYPLLDHLCALESTRLESLPFEKTSDRWSLPDRNTLQTALDGARAVIVVHPNNPTGHFLFRSEVKTLSVEVGRAGAALIADEVFFEHGGGPRRRVATDSECLTFSLGGLSKSAALPHWKLGWIRVTGPEQQKRAAIEALEMIADTYLPVSGPVQQALPEILAMSEDLRRPIEERISRNLEAIDAAIAPVPAITRERFEGGWSVVLRVPVLEGEEKLVLDLIGEGVLVHPGYFYDFPREGWLVISLLSPTEELRRGMDVLAKLLG